MARPVGVYGDIGLFVDHFGGHYGLVSRARSGLRLLDDEANCAYIVTRLPKEPRCDDQFSLITTFVSAMSPNIVVLITPVTFAR